MAKPKSTRHELPNGIIQYRDEEGKLHNDHQSAVRSECGARGWYKHGKLHRTNGPAIKYANGDYAWYENGRRHRTDGPAVKETKTRYEMMEDEYMPLYQTVRYLWYRKGRMYKTESDAEYQYYRNGRLHRTDGPAIESKFSGAYGKYSCEWWLNGKLHRTDGPARVNKNGAFEWYQFGKLHRTDGPAVERIQNTSMPFLGAPYFHLPLTVKEDEWWINGIRINETTSKFIENGLITIEDFAK
jgi:hypothetical protein